jgi:shikimate kinase
VILRLKRTPGIYLVGFMGSGKTTIGRLLAERFEWPFADLDDDIEASRGMTIAGIFAALGEEEFRKTESAALEARIQRVQRGGPIILALGGGAYAQPGVAELLGQNGITIWLDCPLDVAARRVASFSHRPLARDPERFAALYAERQSVYARADYRIDSGGDEPRTAVEQIFSLDLI